MGPQATEQSTTPGRSGLSVWLGAVLILALLLVVLMPRAQAVEPALPLELTASAGVELAAGGAAAEAWSSVLPELPHCHHDHAWRPASGILPRGEAPDATPDPSTLNASVAGPSVHLTSALGHALPGHTSRPAVPLYLLTQRLRS